MTKKKSQISLIKISTPSSSCQLLKEQDEISQGFISVGLSLGFNIEDEKMESDKIDEFSVSLEVEIKGYEDKSKDKEKKPDMSDEAFHCSCKTVGNYTVEGSPAKFSTLEKNIQNFAEHLNISANEHINYMINKMNIPSKVTIPLSSIADIDFIEEKNKKTKKKH